MRVYKRPFFGGGITSDEYDYQKIEPEQGKIVVIVIDRKVFGETKEQHLEVYESIMRGTLVYDGTTVQPQIFTSEREFTIVDKHSPDYMDDICNEISTKSEELNTHFNENIEEAMEIIDNNYLLSKHTREQQEQSKEDIIKAIDDIE